MHILKKFYIHFRNFARMFSVVFSVTRMRMMLAVMSAIRTGILLQSPFREKSRRFVRRARIPGIYFDSRRIQGIHGASTDSATNERGRSVRPQKIRQCFVPSVADINNFRSGDIPVHDFIKLEKLRVPEMLENLSAFI